MLDNKRQYKSDDKLFDVDIEGISPNQPLIDDKSSNKALTDLPPHRVRFKNFDENEEATKMLEIVSLEFSYLKSYLVVPVLGICSALIFFLCLYWFPKLRKMFFYNECNLHQATHLFIQGTLGHMEIVELQNKNDELSEFLDPSDRRAYDQNPFLLFEYRFIKFQYDYVNQLFAPIIFDCCIPFQNIQTRYSGGIQSQADYLLQLIKYGKCSIEVPMKSIPTLLIQEVLNPFYLFQIFSMVLWFWDGYRAYASCILVLSVLSATTSLIETRKNLKSIREMAMYSCTVNVMREGDENQLKTIDSSELVPGDVIEIPENTSMPCDLALLTGSCIVNESMLTGESIPVIKNAIPFTTDTYDPIADQKYTLYGGTKVIQTRTFGQSKVLGLVIRTAFVTTKGNLVRDILYPRPNKFKFYQDSLKFIFCMGILAVIGFLGTLPFMIDQGYDPAAIVDRSLDLLTITVPPALPAAMTIGTVFAINRLKKKRIYCISPPRINVSGRVNLMVFDKTGTLTEDGLQVYGFRGINKAIIKEEEKRIFSDFNADCTTYQPNRQWWLDKLEKEELREDPQSLFLESLATCHSITYVNNELIGDPLDVKMFQATKWILEEQVEEGATDELILAYVRPPTSTEQFKNQRADSLLSISDISDRSGFDGGNNNSSYQLALIRRFDFSSKLQRMSVIVKNFLDQSFRSYVKGSPEKIRELCRPETLPSNFDEILGIYTECGYRVLAMATKPLQMNFLKTQKCQRDDVESDLEFLGLLIMQNKLKPVTINIIQTLNESKIRTIMATGDNVLTAISVGRECNIIDSHTEVFLGDVKKEGDKEVVFWKSTKSGRHVLQPNTLTPNQDFFNDEQKRPGHLSASQILDQSREEDEKSVNDLVSLDDYPWQHPPEDYAVALTGKAFHCLLNDPSQDMVLKQVLFKAQIYARMSPDDKAKLVEQLQKYCKTEVGMCGDGANDCGALKQADIGISLSEAEASIAAPFTSQIQDISSVVIVLREGRCALTTSFQMFKFIELYSMIQFISVTMLYTIGSNLADYQFLYIDLALLVPLSMFMGYTEPYKHLTPHLPSGALISLPVLTSVLGQIVVQAAFQIFAFFFIRMWSFYEPPPPIDPESGDANTEGYENSSLFMLTLYQYVVVCVAFSISKPFRQPLYTNLWFTVSLVVLSVFNIYITVSSEEWIYDAFQIKSNISLEFRLSLICIAVVNGILTFFYEKIFIWYISIWWKNKKDKKREIAYQKEIQEQAEQVKERLYSKAVEVNNKKQQQVLYDNEKLRNNSQINQSWGDKQNLLLDNSPNNNQRKNSQLLVEDQEEFKENNNNQILIKKSYQNGGQR